jgi:hypothetical protein
MDDPFIIIRNIRLGDDTFDRGPNGKMEKIVGLEAAADIIFKLNEAGYLIVPAKALKLGN